VARAFPFCRQRQPEEESRDDGEDEGSEGKKGARSVSPFVKRTVHTLKCVRASV
jgi:hypothetical protein